MSKKFDIVDALASIGLIALVTGVFAAAGDYMAFIGGARLLETLSVLPAGWDAAHRTQIGVAAILIALLPAGYLAWRLFRSAKARAEG